MKAGIPVVAVFDIGKTNKKLLVFDERYKVVKEEVTGFDEIADDDGFPSENLDALTSWMLRQYRQLKESADFQLKAVNFSTYGASMVHTDAAGERVGYLYNYLKPYPGPLMKEFLERRSGADAFAESTSSPVMGHLNAGMQLYWLKKYKPTLFGRIVRSLHFPQYLSFLIAGHSFAEMTSLGCHSAMWDFANSDYHPWVKEEGIREKLAKVIQGDAIAGMDKNGDEHIVIGVGLHDSSAATIPYLNYFKDPFIIVSTGTWIIGLNPFNTTLPTAGELSKGCLSYLTCQGSPVKTSMLFAGHDHDQQVQRIAACFNVSPDFYKAVSPDHEMLQRLSLAENTIAQSSATVEKATTPCIFHQRDLGRLHSASEAYHQLIADMVQQQKRALQMILGNSDTKNIYVDGGFCRNGLFMQLLANAFPGKKVFSATMIQGTALGAALAIHKHWNNQDVPVDLIELKRW
ncbi:MAG: carbohydrate kinase [Chitinophagaceae bacterium]|nr:carbohydrate kinase [Chitinophagaceae bacterium]